MSAARAVERAEPASAAREPAKQRAAPYIVLVGLDLSEPGGRAWRFAFELAALKGESSEVHAIVVGARGMAPPVKDVATRATSSSPRASGGDEPRTGAPLKVLEHRSAEGDPHLMAMHFRTGRPDRAIVTLARDIGADVIVIATPTPSPLQRLFGGSTAERIARAAPCPVVVVRPRGAEATPRRGPEPAPR